MLEDAGSGPNAPTIRRTSPITQSAAAFADVDTKVFAPVLWRTKKLVSIEECRGITDIKICYVH